MSLEREWETFQRELPRLLAEGHRGQYALIVGDRVDSLWPTLDAALAEGHERFGLTPFMAQEVEDNPKPVYVSYRVVPCRP